MLGVPQYQVIPDNNIGYPIPDDFQNWNGWVENRSSCWVAGGYLCVCICLFIYISLFEFVCVCVCLCVSLYLCWGVSMRVCVCVCVCLFLFVYMCVKTCVIGLSPPPMYCLSNETDRWLQLVLAFVKMIQSQKRSIQNRWDWDKRCS